MPSAGEVDAALLEDAARVAVAHNLTALAWLDSDLNVTETHGKFAAGMPIGQHVSTGMLALFGFDKQIKALRSDPRARLELPNIAIATATGTGPRLSLHVMWCERSDRYLVIVASAIGQADLERGLIEQSRKRQLAEERELAQALEIKHINAELTRVNRDLSEFADIISHDLRAPLRGMRYYAEDLEQAVAQGNMAAIRGLVERLRTQSMRMTRMLNDLLDYARAGRKDEIVEQVDTRALIEAIIASLPRPEDFVIVASGEWPVIETLAAPLDLVLRNLVDNAIKHHDRGAGRVELRGRIGDGRLQIDVADDGPGIPKAKHELVFLPFRTLGGSAAAGRGSGMGLALVRRVVEAVGAVISLDSDPVVARGTTFRISWPMKPTLPK